MGGKSDVSLFNQTLEGARVAVVRLVHVFGAKVAARVPATQLAHHSRVLKLAVVGR